jgi:sugar phosphate isomerase/epimerase
MTGHPVRLTRRPIGVVHVTLAPLSIEDAARRGRELGFEHIDVPATWENDAELALPIGDRMAFPSPRPGCSVPAPPDEPGMWDRAVAAYRRVPGVRVEPWGGSIVSSVAAARELLDAVPGLQLLVDTGHVAAWGEDPVELLEHAGHVQFRQARRGVVQARYDDGDVDFARVLARLDEVDYRGRVSVEYFDLPERGWPLDDPAGYAVDLAARVRALMS